MSIIPNSLQNLKPCLYKKAQVHYKFQYSFKFKNVHIYQDPKNHYRKIELQETIQKNYIKKLATFLT